MHAHFDNWLVPVTLALWPTRARLLWHIHSTRQPDGGPLRRTPQRAVKFGLIGARVAAFVCVTETIAGEVREFGAGARKIVVVRNAVDAAGSTRPTPRRAPGCARSSGSMTGRRSRSSAATRRSRAPTFSPPRWPKSPT